MDQKQSKTTTWLIVIAALGYFVDIYDLILFNVIKAPSLEAIGITGALYEKYEIGLFNWQMSGMLIGGLLWGILGDKKGRISVLFGSILLYSLANIANGFVTSIEQYIAFRFIAGIGLAGELGAGITLISETMPKEKRGIGTMIIVSFGALGAVAAVFVSHYYHWQTAYFIGGGMGLVLLLLRAGALESGMYKDMKTTDVRKGRFLALFSDKDTLLKYLRCIAIGLPIWFMIGVLVNLASNFVDLPGVAKKTLNENGILFAYLGLSAGDVCCGLVSQWLRSRKKAVYLFMVLSVIIITIYLTVKTDTLPMYQLMCFLLGAGTGYWALFVQVASENFGTNIRSTVTNTVPNFVRGAVVPITLSFKYLKSALNSPSGAAIIVGAACLLIAALSLRKLDETFSKDLDYLEQH